MQKEISVKQALTQLKFDKGVTIGDLTTNLLLSNYKEIYEKTKDPEKKKFVKNCRDLIEKQIVSNEMQLNRFFVMDAPYSECVCNRCKGGGLIFKFQQGSVTKPCRVCSGTGKIAKICRACKGTGKYKKNHNGVESEVECNKCFGHGSNVWVICQKCMGKGEVKLHFKTHEIKSTTECPVCKGVGFFDKKNPPVLTPDNPVLTESEAETISSAITQ